MMKMLLVFATALLMGIPQTTRGSTSTTPVSNFASDPKVQRIMQLLTTSNFADCIDTQKDVCTHGSGGMGDFDRDTFCRSLKIVSQCIDNCGQALKDGVNQGLQDFTCGGCGFLHASLLVLILAAFVHYFV